ncbi:transmembrane protein 169-like [Elysia marginata]|uniref:Transmembrane protein 169-like n=1 Tax=Elysia marginata TaxID=1093978 RepID=A0AAV4F4I9_9GAST|nr:transmembrane protein 169-like [Elysia marginata]
MEIESIMPTDNKPSNVELVELSEQTEPLLQRKNFTVPPPLQNDDQQASEKVIGVIENEDHNEIKEAPLDKSLPSTTNTSSIRLTPEPECGKTSPSSPTQSVSLPLYGGSIPKNRKRPGSTSDGQRVTMTGTVMRGNSVGQPVEVQLELTETEFHRLTTREPPSKPQQLQDKFCRLGLKQGPHVTVWSLLCMPAAFLYSLCVAFYNGAMTWYNLVVYLSEEPSSSLVQKVLLCPLVILSFPLTVGLSCLVLAVAAMFMQVSWSWHAWWLEFCDGEKGFYGWVCSKVGLPDCSPYQVVVLDDTGVL